MHVELIAITPKAEKVIEEAGRACYRSGSKSRVGSERHFIHKIIKNGHHSVLEHAYATFRITGVACENALFSTDVSNGWAAVILNCS